MVKKKKEFSDFDNSNSKKVKKNGKGIENIPKITERPITTFLYGASSLNRFFNM
jgi:hypothetical protein